MATPEDKKKSRRPWLTGYDKDNHTLLIKTTEGRGAPYKVPLDDLVPRPVPMEAKRALTIQHQVARPSIQPSNGLWRAIVGGVCSIGVVTALGWFCKGAIEESGAQFMRKYWPQVFAEEEKPRRRR